MLRLFDKKVSFVEINGFFDVDVIFDLVLRIEDKIGVWFGVGIGMRELRESFLGEVGFFIEEEKFFWWVIDLGFMIRWSVFMDLNFFKVFLKLVFFFSFWIFGFGGIVFFIRNLFFFDLGFRGGGLFCIEIFVKNFFFKDLVFV